MLPRKIIKHKRYRCLLASIALALIMQFVAIRLEPQVLTITGLTTNSDTVSFSRSPARPSKPAVAWIPTFGPEVVQATGGLTITKRANPTHPLAIDQGGLITYTLIISNNTGDDLEQILVTDTVPLNTDCSSLNNMLGWFSNPMQCHQDRLALWFSGGGTVLNNNDSVELTYAVSVTAPLIYPSIITNDNYSVTADKVGGGASYVDYPNRPITTTVNSPSWEIQKTVLPEETVPAGGLLTYTITVTNIGSMPTNGPYIITDTIPDNTSLSDNPDGGSVNASVITWVLADPDLAQNQSSQVQYSVQVASPLTDGQIILNQTYAVNGGGAIGPVFGTPVSVTVAAAPQLSITKTAKQSMVNPGDTITYTITYSNIGNAISGDFIISDMLPLSTTYVDSTPPDVNIANRTFGWVGSNLSPADGPQLITMAVETSSSLNHGTPLTNSVIISSTDSFDTATNLVTSEARPDLIIHKSDSTGGASVQAGETVTYTITYTNAGTGILAALQITDTLPTSVTLESADPGIATQIGADPPVFTQAGLAVGETGIITLVARLDETPWPAPGFSFINNVIASVDINEVNVIDNVASVTTTGQPAPPFAIVLEVPTQASVGVNTPVTATVTDQYGNFALDGTSIAFGVDSPGSLDAPSATTSNGLAVAEISANVPTTVSVTASYGVISDTQTIVFVKPALTKIATPNPVLAGETITYTIIYRNVNDSPLSNLRITDTLPTELSSIDAISASDMTLADNTPPNLVFTQNNLAIDQTTVVTIVGKIKTAPWPSTPTLLLNTATAIHDAEPAPVAITVNSLVHPNVAGYISLEASSTTYLVGDSAVITGTVTDQYGNPVLNGTRVNVTTSLTDSNVTSSGLTQNGLVTATVTANLSSTTTITMEVDGLTASENLTFTQSTLMRHLYMPIVLKRTF